MPKILLNLAEPAYPLPKFVQRELSGFLSKVHKFPRNYRELKKAIAGEFHVSSENVMLTNGADAAIDLVGRTFGKKTLIFTPAYLEYEWAPHRDGYKVERVNAMKGKLYDVNADDARVKRASLVFLANPNNPFGYTEKPVIERLLKNAGGIVAVDEAYAWFKGKSIASLVKKRKNLLVIGTFSKSLSLIGMRIGYIIGPKRLLTEIGKKKLYFNVSALSVQAAIIGLKHKKHFKGNVKRVVRERKAFEGWLEKKGFDVYKTETNNALVKFPSKKEATRFTKHLKKSGIIVLQGNGISVTGLDDSFARITIGNSKEMAIVRKVISSFPHSAARRA